MLICDLEVVMRPSSKSSKKTKTHKSRSSGRGKWKVVANTARFLSVSVTDMVVKVSLLYKVSHFVFQNHFTFHLHMHVSDIF